MRITATGAAALLLLAACGADDAATDDPAVTVAAEDHAGMNQGDRDHGTYAEAEAGGMAMAQGRVVGAPEGSRVRIDHGPIDAIGMAAMTMTFEAKRGVDLAGIDAGDEVHFLLDRGRDGTFRLEAICDVAADDHEACMAAMMAKR